MTDLAAWSDRVSRSSEQLLERFDKRYGYPPGVNVVVPGTGQGGSQLSQELGPGTQVPPSIVEFFNVIDEVSLPDVWNGYFLGPATWVAAKHADRYPRWLELGGQRVEILVIGSDGGGALYVVGVEEDSPVFRIEEAAIESGVLCPTTDRQVQRLAANFSAFLELFANSLESYAAGGITPSF
ncbi:hypothetical protein ACWEOO_04180 [Kribbella sp. NPDC004138]